MVVWLLCPFWAGASAVSGFCAAACSLPFDFVKTQIQKMQPDAQGKYPYTGSLDCAMQTLKSGGPLKFYTGFPVYCVRIAPHVMVYFLSFFKMLFRDSLQACLWDGWWSWFIFGRWHGSSWTRLQSSKRPLVCDLQTILVKCGANNKTRRTKTQLELCSFTFLTIYICLEALFET